MIHTETTMAEYQARQALSAGMAWQGVTECWAQAWHDSVFNPERRRQEARHYDFGTAVHFAIEDQSSLGKHVVVIDADSYRTKTAKEARDRAYLEGRVPLLVGDYQAVGELRRVLEASEAAPLLFGEGRSEVSYTWEWAGVPCKARVDRLASGHLIDLKTAVSAGPQAFQRAMVRDGHHLRAAWYLDGWLESVFPGAKQGTDYLYVVVAKTPPHLVAIYRLDERAVEWGRRLYRKALREFAQCRETGVWPGYCPAFADKTVTVSLPAFSEYQLGELEDEGEL